MANLYDLLMAPLERRWLQPRRAALMREARGRVLEIGFGTGANLRYYLPEAIATLTALDPVFPPEFPVSNTIPITRVKGFSEALPFEDSAFDTVVETLVLCSVGDLDASLAEIYRVLKPGGRFIFMDHVLPDDRRLSRIFSGADLLWPHIAHGCHLTRSPHTALEGAGFSIRQQDSFAGGVFRFGIAEKPIKDMP